MAQKAMTKSNVYLVEFASASMASNGWSIHVAATDVEDAIRTARIAGLSNGGATSKDDMSTVKSVKLLVEDVWV